MRNQLSDSLKAHVGQTWRELDRERGGKTMVTDLVHDEEFRKRLFERAGIRDPDHGFDMRDVLFWDDEPSIVTKALSGEGRYSIPEVVEREYKENFRDAFGLAGVERG